MSIRYWRRKDDKCFVSGRYRWTLSHSAREPDATGAVQLYSPSGYHGITLMLAELQECDEYGIPLSLYSEPTAPNPKPRPHASLIHAWAEGAEIQFYDPGPQQWVDIKSPRFLHDFQYRIKPDLSKERAELAEVEQQVSKLQSEIKQRMEELDPLIDKRNALRKVVANG